VRTTEGEDVMVNDASAGWGSGGIIYLYSDTAPYKALKLEEVASVKFTRPLVYPPRCFEVLFTEDDLLYYNTILVYHQHDCRVTRDCMIECCESELNSFELAALTLSEKKALSALRHNNRYHSDYNEITRGWREASENYARLNHEND